MLGWDSCQATSRDLRKLLKKEIVMHINEINKQNITSVLVSFRGAGRQIL